MKFKHFSVFLKSLGGFGLILFLGLSLFSACEVQERVVVRTRPPEPALEVPPPPPFSGALWIRGEWIWDGGARQYFWHPGHYERIRPASVWIGGHWQETRWGWHWVPGHWR